VAPQVKPPPKAASTILSPFFNCFSQSHMQSRRVPAVVLHNFVCSALLFQGKIPFDKTDLLKAVKSREKKLSLKYEPYK